MVSDMSKEKLVDLALAIFKSNNGVASVNDAALQELRAAFSAFATTDNVVDVVTELMQIAFFFEEKKQARVVALAIVEVARLGTALLRQRGFNFDGVADAAQAHQRRAQELLGQSPTVQPSTQVPETAVKWWMVR